MDTPKYRHCEPQIIPERSKKLLHRTVGGEFWTNAIGPFRRIQLGRSGRVEGDLSGDSRWAISS